MRKKIISRQTIPEKIKQRRRQLLVHSYIYYELDQNIITDQKWSKWAMELVHLQSQYPQEASVVEYADMFKDWDGSSGAFLQFPEDIRAIADKLLKRQVVERCSIEHKKPSQKKKSTRRSLF